MTTVSPDRRAELTRLFPIGSYLTITDPLPTRGVIAEHGEHGIKLTHDGRTCGFLSWALLAAARVGRSSTVAEDQS